MSTVLISVTVTGKRKILQISITQITLSRSHFQRLVKNKNGNVSEQLTSTFIFQFWK